MNEKKNQFGVWMDGHRATVVEKENESAPVKIIQHVKGELTPANSNENTAHNHAQTLEHKFFKDIAHQMQNAHYIHLTGTGVSQEKFKHFLAETPQFKNVKVEMCTSKEMNDEKLKEFFEDKLK